MHSMIRGIVASVAILTLLVAMPERSHAGLLFENQQLGYQYLWPNQSSVYFDPGPILVGPGVELPGLYTAGHNSDATVDFSDTEIRIDFYTSGPWWTAGFNGFRVYDINDTLPDFTSVALGPGSNMAGLDVSRIQFDSDNIYLDWNGLMTTTETIVSLYVNVPPPLPPPTPASHAGAAPEPGMLSIVAVGLLGSVFRRRRVARRPGRATVPGELVV
ncbi:hypothetical protein Mal15_11300 [Stieleria maiorica]|uniref:Ice-binding protein C-terminal domain-containing protein n=1 Tax=Stieleria maiorica TaxID=2795974 RepID=A0A5B9MBW9_9BACT|nr:PEP-CTERM sorting domain-containing protein [Stieleria maiorica]QEF97094.1 hypothetical protein Mal15_11300 [Stieleria maiorica]